jgi:hypothetical protein
MRTPAPALTRGELDAIEADAVSRFAPLYASMDVVPWLRSIDPVIVDPAEHIGTVDAIAACAGTRLGDAKRRELQRPRLRELGAARNRAIAGARREREPWPISVVPIVSVTTFDALTASYESTRPG